MALLTQPGTAPPKAGFGPCLGHDYVGSDRVVDDLVRRLRRKLPEFRVETIYGYGYRLVKS